MSQPQAFDTLAPTYDTIFTHTPIGRYLRERVRARLNTYFHAGHHILEMGCGTGEDALFLANHGVHVTATDVSDGMLTTARAKAAGNPLVQFERFDLRNTANNYQLSSADLFDGVFSNFGALNCLAGWKPLAAWLAQRLKLGAVVGLGIMSPLCIWEPLWHGLHLDFKVATRRWRKSAPFQPDHMSEPITVTYPTIGRITNDFAPYFQRVYVEGVGLFLPPSDVFGVIEKRPRLLKFLMGLENRFGKYPQLALFADHYWIEFEAVSTQGK